MRTVFIHESLSIIKRTSEFYVTNGRVNKNCTKHFPWCFILVPNHVDYRSCQLSQINVLSCCCSFWHFLWNMLACLMTMLFLGHVKSSCRKAVKKWTVLTFNREKVLTILQFINDARTDYLVTIFSIHRRCIYISDSSKFWNSKSLDSQKSF